MIAAGLLMGLASSPHCALMCSAPCAAIARSCSAVPGHGGQALLAWHAGRALAYTLAGAVAASAVALIATLAAGSAILRPLWTMLQAAVLVLGAALLWSGRMPRWVDGAAQNLARAAPMVGPRPPSRNSEPRRTALIGLN